MKKEIVAFAVLAMAEIQEVLPGVELYLFCKTAGEIAINAYEKGTGTGHILASFNCVVSRADQPVSWSVRDVFLRSETPCSRAFPVVRDAAQHIRDLIDEHATKIAALIK